MIDDVGVNSSRCVRLLTDPYDEVALVLVHRLSLERVDVPAAPDPRADRSDEPGLFLELSIPPGSVQVGDQSLEVTAKGAWVQADRLRLYVNDRLDQTVEAASHTFELSPDRDAFYVVIAEGDTPMSPVYSSTPWAMASAIFIDENGDGWTAPKPPLTLTGSE